jgi:hypothetical protein
VLTALIGPSSTAGTRSSACRILQCARPAPPRPAPRPVSGLEGVQVHVRDVRVSPPRASPTRPTPRLRTAECRPAPRLAVPQGSRGVQVDAAAVEQAQLHRASLRPCGGQSGQPPLYPAAPPARRPLATCPKARPTPRRASGLEGVEVDAAAVKQGQRAARAQYSQRV